MTQLSRGVATLVALLSFLTAHRALAQASDAGAPPPTTSDAGPTQASSDAGVSLSADASAPSGTMPLTTPPPAPVPAPITAPTSTPPAISKPAPPKEPPTPPAKETKEPAEKGPPLWTGTMRFADRYYELGVVAGPGNGLLFAAGAETVGLTGIRVLEHHGYISKLFVAAIVAMGQSDKKYVGSSYSNYYTAYGTYTVRTDYYRSLTPEERAAQQKAVEDAANGQYTTEIIAYSPGFLGLEPGKTQGSGFEASLGGDIVLGFIGPLPAILTLGGWGSYISAPVVWKGSAAPPPGSNTPQASRPSELVYGGFGAFARLHVPVTRFADLSAEWDLNVLSFFDFSAEKREKEGLLYQSPLKIGAYVHLTDRAYIQGKAILGGFGVSDGKLGGQAELGIRF